MFATSRGTSIPVFHLQMEAIAKLEASGTGQPCRGYIIICVVVKEEKTWWQTMLNKPTALEPRGTFVLTKNLYRTLNML